MTKKENKYTTGIVRCEVCGEILGNYQTDDYYRLIRLKYCDNCRAEVNREMKRKAAKKYRQRRREYHSLIEERNRLLEEENKAMRLRLFGTESPEEAKRLADFLLSIAHTPNSSAGG